MTRLHPWPLRAIRALFAFWFAVSVGEPAIVQVCPMHGTGAMAASVAMAAMHAHDATHPGGQAPTHAPDHQHHHCACVGCCTGVAAVTVASRVELAAPAFIERDVVAPSATTSAPRAAPPHALPLGTGPPTRATGA